MPRSAESRKMCRSQSVLPCSRWTWSPATSTVRRGVERVVKVHNESVRLKKPLRTPTCQYRTALHPCGDPVASQTNGQTCAGGSETEWQIRMHGAHEINREVLGIKPTEQSCHHEVWIRLLHVTAWQVIRERKGSAITERQDWRPYAKKKGPNPWDQL